MLRYIHTIQKTFKTLEDAAICELNRRSKLLYYHNGKIGPPYVWKYLNEHFQSNSIDYAHQKWAPYRAVLFGNEDPLNLIGMIRGSELVTVTSQKDHLEIQKKICLWNGNNQLTFSDGEKSLMSGIIIPYNSVPSRKIPLSSIDLKQISFEMNNSENDDNLKSEVKLAIVITSDSGQTKAYERASMTAQSLRWTMFNRRIPICIVAQSDTREEKKIISTYDQDNVILFFNGTDVNASTFVINTTDQETLKKRFLEWKKELSFFNSHQIFAFHFTVVNGTEPENSEEIFKNTFQNVHLSTLRLLDEQSIIGINHQDENKYSFDNGPVYIIIGLKKWIKREN